MKKLLLSAAMIGFVVFGANAQSNTTPTQPAQPVEQKEQPAQPAQPVSNDSDAVKSEQLSNENDQQPADKPKEQADPAATPAQDGSKKD